MQLLIVKWRMKSKTTYPWFRAVINMRLVPFGIISFCESILLSMFPKYVYVPVFRTWRYPLQKFDKDQVNLALKTIWWTWRIMIAWQSWQWQNCVQWWGKYLVPTELFLSKAPSRDCPFMSCDLLDSFCEYRCTVATVVHSFDYIIWENLIKTATFMFTPMLMLKFFQIQFQHHCSFVLIYYHKWCMWG